MAAVSQAVFLYESQTKEVLLHEIRIGYTTDYNHERHPLEFLVTDRFNNDDISISLRVIDQNRKLHMTKSAGQEKRHTLVE